MWKSHFKVEAVVLDLVDCKMWLYSMMEKATRKIPLRHSPFKAPSSQKIQMQPLSILNSHLLKLAILPLLNRLSSPSYRCLLPCVWDQLEKLEQLLLQLQRP